MRTESVTKRPFFRIPQEVQDAFDSCAIRFAETEDFDRGPSILCTLPPSEARLEVEPGPRLEEALADCEWRDQWDFSVVLTDESRRRSRPLAHTSVARLSSSFVVPTSNLPLSWNGRHGGTLSLFLVQTADIPRQVGLPHREAQAVALKHFGINKAGPGVEFPVRFASPEELRSLGYGAEATVVVTAAPEDLHEDDLYDARVEILVNERLRAAFASARRSRRQNVVQDNIRSQALAELLFLAKAAGKLEAGSIGYKLVTRVLRKQSTDGITLESVPDVELFARAQCFAGLTDSCARLV